MCVEKLEQYHVIRDDNGILITSAEYIWYLLFTCGYQHEDVINRYSRDDLPHNGLSHEELLAILELPVVAYDARGVGTTDRRIPKDE